MRKLLLADDDRDLEPLVRVMLKGLGFRIDAAHDGAHALALMEKGSYSVVLLDVMMPKLNGIEVIERLIAQSPDVAKRVIVVTAADPKLLRSLDRTAIGGVILKPFDVDSMMTLVEQVADGHSALRRSG